jgi:hypothetical protein
MRVFRWTCMLNSDVVTMLRSSPATRRGNDTEKIEYGYDYAAKTFLEKPYTSIKGIQLALEEIAERNLAARTANPEQFIDLSIVKELDQSGYIDARYK